MMKEREVALVAVEWVSHLFASQHEHIQFTICHGSRSPEMMAAFYDELNKQMPWERTFSFAEMMRLEKQEERPNNPYLLRMWKMVKHARRYTMDQEGIKRYKEWG
jgi:hypothetical protein